MDQKEHTSNPKGVCEKLFNALSVNPTFRSFRRISHHPQTPPPVASTPPPPPPPSTIDYNASSLGSQNKPNTLGKHEAVTGLRHTHGVQNKPNTLGKNEPVTGFGYTHGAQAKPNTLGKNESLMGSGHTHKQEKSKVPEAVIPPKADLQLPSPLTPTNVKEKLTPAPIPVPAQEKVKSQVAKVNSKTEPAPPYASVQEKRKPNTEANLASPPQGKAGQGKSNDAKVEPPPPPPPQVVPGKAADPVKTRSHSINDKASDYITRAKTRLRTTTTAGGGRFSSFK